MSDEFDDEIILSELNDEELVQQMHDDLYDGLQEEVIEGVNILLERGWTPYKVLTEALVAGMTIVGIDFRDGILFVPEVLMAANAMKAGMKILRPLLAETGAPQVGKIVIAAIQHELTVKRYVKKDGKVYLAPENDAFEPILVSEEDEVHIWGVVTNVVHAV